jgi:hypothetical protein
VFRQSPAGYSAAIRPVIVTWVALVAVTVNVDEPPEVIEVGLAVMLTVGAGGGATAVRLRSRSRWPWFRRFQFARCRVSGGRGRADRLRSASRLQV